MRKAVVGSRSLEDYEYFCMVMRGYLKPGDVIVSGGAPTGPDAMAERFAEENGFEIKVWPADWSTGKLAGFARNKDIVEDCGVLLAFWDEVSPGTKDAIDYCRKVGRPHRIEKFTKYVKPDQGLGDLFE